MKLAARVLGIALALLLVASDWSEAEKKDKKSKHFKSWGDTWLAFTPDGGRIVFADWRGKVMLLDFPSMKLLAEYEGEEGKGVEYAALSRDGGILVASFEKGSAWAWDVQSTAVLWKVTPSKGSIAFALHPVADELVLYEGGSGLVRRRLADGVRVGTPVPTDTILTAFAFSAHGRYLLAGGLRGGDLGFARLRLFDLEEEALLAEFDSVSYEWGHWEGMSEEEFLELVEATGVLADPGCRSLGPGRKFCGRSDELVLFDERGQEPRDMFPGGRFTWRIRGKKGMWTFTGADLSPDERWVVAVSAESFHLFDTQDLEQRGFKGLASLGVTGQSWMQPKLVETVELP